MISLSGRKVHHPIHLAPPALVAKGPELPEAPGPPAAVFAHPGAIVDPMIFAPCPLESLGRAPYLAPAAHGEGTLVGSGPLSISSSAPRDRPFIHPSASPARCDELSPGVPPLSVHPHIDPAVLNPRPAHSLPPSSTPQASSLSPRIPGGEAAGLSSTPRAAGAGIPPLPSERPPLHGASFGASFGKGAAAAFLPPPDPLDRAISAPAPEPSLASAVFAAGNRGKCIFLARVKYKGATAPLSILVDDCALPQGTLLSYCDCAKAGCKGAAPYDVMELAIHLGTTPIHANHDWKMALRVVTEAGGRLLHLVEFLQKRGFIS